MADPTTHRGAGILFVTPDKKGLFLKRGPGGDYPGYWCFAGGTTEGNETPEETAKREAEEELGKYPKGTLALHCRTLTYPPPSPIPGAGGRIDFTTFVQRVTEEFAPTLNGEHTGYAWAPLDAPPEPLHPGCATALQRFGWDELGVARAMQSGTLTSPQLYGNVHLFDLRVTGTGIAYRGPKVDDTGKMISPEELVYRRPENYLTDEFLQRCNGLSVIMMHPAKALLTSKEFGARVVGGVMLPYIKGDEVWAIARIYDDEAIAAMRDTQMSTSPAVLLGNGDRKLKTEDGTDLLIEGKPTLLDHLAICSVGVWDKGGDPTGVRTDNQGDTTMPLTKEELEAQDKRFGEIIAGTVPGLLKAALSDTTFLTAVRADSAKADADAGTKLDKCLSAIDSALNKMDSFSKRMDAFEKKMDSDEDEKPVKKDSESDDDFKKRSDAFEEAKAKKDADMIAADKAKKDSEEAEAKKKADAEEEEAKKKADSASASDAAIRKEIDDVKRLLPKQLTDEDRGEFSKAQARADEVYMQFSKKAPYPMTGETPLAYRKRLVGNLKEHSPDWKDVDILAIADSVTFAIAEKAILAGAAHAALHPADLKDDELREIVRVDSGTGTRVIEFRGRQSFVTALKSPARYVKAISVRKEA